MSMSLCPCHLLFRANVRVHVCDRILPCLFQQLSALGTDEFQALTTQWTQLTEVPLTKAKFPPLVYPPPPP
jgi:hypothetical protein